MVHSNRGAGRAAHRMVMIALLAGIGVFLNVAGVRAQEKDPKLYSLTIDYPDGRVKKLDGVVSHQLISEKDAVFMSVILKDGRRFLISVQDREFEFSKELNDIIEAENKKTAEKEAPKIQ